jgi:thioredoxin-dependent peroxiredoxin
MLPLRSRLILTLFISLAIGMTNPTHAQDVGDPAPVFQAVADDGELWQSADHVGQSILVVYFYPAAMTGGCTDQACSFRDNRSTLQELGAEVVGVSGDRVENLRMFKRANRLNFPLLSDSTGDVARAFGVPLRDGGTITREIDGERIELTRDVTASRWTFIIDRDGTITHKGVDVDPAGDGEAVLEIVRRMTAG